MVAEVLFVDGQPNGLAALLGGLIQANLASHPHRARYLRGPAIFSVRAPDADVGVSIRLSAGRAAVRNGVVQRAHVRIEADSEVLVALSSVPLRLGLPDVTTKEGRAVILSVLRGRLRIRGLLVHPGKLARLNKLLSVN